jgi:hypothetical protein
MLDQVEHRFFEVLPLEFCLEFLVAPVQVDDREIHVVGRDPIAPRVLRYIERITRRSVVAILCDEDVEERIAGLLTVMCRTPAVAERTGASQEELLSVLRHPPVWGPDCWEKVRQVNVTLASTSGDDAWVSVLPPATLSIKRWTPASGFGMEHRVTIDRDVAVSVSGTSDRWAVMMSAPDDSVQTMQFTRHVGADGLREEGMSLGSGGPVLVAAFDEDRSAAAFRAQLEQLLQAVARPARVFARPPALWR